MFRHRMFALAALVTLVSCREGPARTKAAGDRMQPFIVKDCETGERHCQICAYSGKPLIMAVGDLSDAAFLEDLKRIDEIVAARADKGLRAFALLGDLSGGALAPTKDEAGTMAKLKELKGRLGLSFPVVAVPSEMTAEEKRGYRPFNDSYEVKASRTVLFADAEGKVLHAEVMKGGELTALEAAISKAL